MQVEEKYKVFTRRKSRIITGNTVDVIANGNMKSENAKAKILAYDLDGDGKPDKYKIEFAKGFYLRHKHDPHMIEQIVDHELAHIKAPNTHDAKFRRWAKKLGTCKRYQKER